MSDPRTNCLKTVLQLTSQLMLAVGILVWLNGVYLLIKYGENSRFFSESYMTLTVLVIVTSAALLLVTGCLGSWVSLKDSICLQGLFVYLLVVVFCVKSTASALAYFHSVTLDTEMAPFSGVFENYTGSSEDSNSRSVDAMQEELKCCGVKNYTDWLETTWFNKSGGLRFPYSCCNVTFPTCNGTVYQPWQIYTQGCQEELSKVIQFALKMDMWSSLLVYVVEIGLFVMVKQLMRTNRSTRYQVLEKN
ncbi:tetraspanin 37 isoform X1 [Astatotilapia calliptera]|uniref:Tetraspanin n=1 Tax=Astatotilapia calliptera TaxID=8154 RepID=A0AAX7SKV8_ASTCA|nr:tetraspanin-3-like isoform X1 [Astatotilapia calliptera]